VSIFDILKVRFKMVTEVPSIWNVELRSVSARSELFEPTIVTSDARTYKSPAWAYVLTMSSGMHLGGERSRESSKLKVGSRVPS